MLRFFVTGSMLSLVVFLITTKFVSRWYSKNVNSQQSWSSPNVKKYISQVLPPISVLLLEFPRSLLNPWFCAVLFSGMFCDPWTLICSPNLLKFVQKTDRLLNISAHTTRVTQANITPTPAPKKYKLIIYLRRKLINNNSIKNSTIIPRISRPTPNKSVKLKDGHFLYQMINEKINMTRTIQLHMD